jgi:hypothetical protein
MKKQPQAYASGGTEEKDIVTIGGDDSLSINYSEDVLAGQDVEVKTVVILSVESPEEAWTNICIYVLVFTKMFKKHQKN